MSENQTQVHLRRRPPETHLPAKIANKSKLTLASVYKDGQPLGLLDKDLEKDLLKKHLNIDDNATDYGEKRNNFWKELRIPVPTEGVVLNIAKTEDGSPFDTEDYIKYKWATAHPLVAGSEQEMKSDHRKQFYIYDPVKETAQNNQKLQIKKQAYIELANISKDREKLEVLGRVLLPVSVENLSAERLENDLASFIEDDPKRFVELAKDEDVEIRSKIYHMVDKGVIRNQGGSYLYMDKTLGDSIGETINFFKNKRNSETVLDLESKLKDLV